MELHLNISAPGLDVRDLMTFLAGKYLPGEEIFLSIYYGDRLLERVSPEGYDLHAVTMKASNLPGCYNIIINSKCRESMVNILCHEFAHLIQMVRGDLDYNLINGKYLWKEEIWGKEVPYEIRPWEKEACKMQRKFYKEYNRHLKKCK